MKETAMNTLFLRCPRALLPAAVTALTLAGCAAKPRLAMIPPWSSPSKKW
jgi:hypothetical protein